jgi:hypothetical protein
MYQYIDFVRIDLHGMLAYRVAQSKHTVCYGCCEKERVLICGGYRRHYCNLLVARPVVSRSVEESYFLNGLCCC